MVPCFLTHIGRSIASPKQNCTNNNNINIYLKQKRCYTWTKICSAPVKSCHGTPVVNLWLKQVCLFCPETSRVGGIAQSCGASAPEVLSWLLHLKKDELTEVTKAVKRDSVASLQIHATEWVEGINKMCNLTHDRPLKNYCIWIKDTCSLEGKLWQT